MASWPSALRLCRAELPVVAISDADLGNLVSRISCSGLSFSDWGIATGGSDLGFSTAVAEVLPDASPTALVLLKRASALSRSGISERAVGEAMIAMRRASLPAPNVPQCNPLRSGTSSGAASSTGPSDCARLPSEAAVQRERLRMARVACSLHVRAPASVPARQHVASVSLKAVVSKKANNALKKCWLFFMAIGNACPRYAELHEQGTMSQAAVDVQERTFRGTFKSPEVLLDCVQEASVLVQWASSLKRDPWALSPLQVACFVREQSARGPAVPARMLRALAWCERKLS